jgi:DNA ligase 1
MKAFAQLFADLDTTNKTNAKLDILKQYLAQAPDADRLWLLALFTHKRPRRQVTATQLRQWAAEAADIPDWLFEESYHTTGDLAETIALVLPLPIRPHEQPLHWWIGFMQGLAPLAEAEKKAQILWAWQGLEPRERFLFIKLMTGGFRIGISQQLITRAVAEVCELDKAVVAHRLMGNWQPDQTDFQQLIMGAANPDAPAAGLAVSQPYPFCLAHPVDEARLADLGPAAHWQAEWKWDGIRAQVIVRQGELFVWTRGEELVTDKYPELQALLAPLAPASGLVLDGELLAWANHQPLPFAELQKRIGRKTLSKKLLQEVPVALVAYDLLELNGRDLREQPLAARRQQLEQLVAQANCPALHASPVVAAADWPQLAAARQQARAHGAEGLMLKRLDSAYQTGRVRGHWWKWKVQPLSIDGVLLYAQKGHGRRATLYTDYTFGVWQGDRLVTFAKAYSGLTDAEIKEVDAFVKKNTLEKFGPVRTVKPELVFEIGFEGIQRSNRHKSGVALRFPRILRWRLDKTAAQADKMEALLALAEGL